VSDVGTVLTPLFCLLAWAKEPITERTMNFLLQTHHLAGNPRWGELFRRAFEHGHLMLQQRPTPENEAGWTIYHHSFRQHLLESGTVSENREWAQERWLKVCEDWKVLASQEPSLHRCILRHYAEYLREAKRWDELFALARDDEFRQAQAHAFPGDPDLPLRTVQAALLGAAEKDDAGAMAEFLLTHARRLLEITQESPLYALRQFNLQRAWELADLFDIERCVLWHLLLAWELKDMGRLEDARVTLDRLLEKNLPWLSFQWSRLAIILLVQTFDINEKGFTTLHKQLLDDKGIRTLCQQLAAHSHFAAALEAARNLRNDDKQAALQAIAEAQIEAGEFEPAVQTAESIHPPERIWILNKIARARAKSAQIEAARETFAAALRIAHQLEDEEREIGLALIAEAQAETGEFAAALQIALGIENQWLRERTLCKISIAQAQSNQTQAAQSTFALCEFKEKTLVGCHEFTHEILEKERAEVLRVIAAAQARAGETEAAQATFSSAVQAALQMEAGDYETGAQIGALCEIAMWQAQVGQAEAARATFAIAIQTVQQAETLIEDNYSRHKALLGIAVAQAKSGQFDDAIQTAQQIKYAFLKSEALREIGKVQALAGDEQGAQANFAAAVQIAQGIETETDRIEALALIAGAQAQLGHIAEARATFSAAETVHRTGHYKYEGDRRYLDRALIEIAQAQVAVGDIAGMLQTVQQIEDIGQRVETLRGFAEAQVRAGETEAARVIRTALRTACGGTLQIGSQIDDGFYVRYAFLLRGIAEVQTQTGDAVGAKTTLETAYRVAQHIQHQYLRVCMLSEIAVAQAQGGDREAARATLVLALEIAKGSDDEYNRERSLLKVGVAQAQAGEREMARATFDLVLQAAQQIDHHPQRARALAAIVAGQAEAEETELAQATFSVMAETVQQIPHQYKRDEVLVDVAGALANAGKKAVTFALQAVRLIEDARDKAEALKKVAVSLAETGEFDAANQTARVIELKLEQIEALKEIKRVQDRISQGTGQASPLVEAGDKENFKRLLVPSPYSLDAAYRMCGLLARLYPEQAAAVAGAVRKLESAS